MREVGPKHLLVERVIEGVAHEECPDPTPQEAERSEGHVLSRRDVGRNQIVGIEDDRDDQEVEVRSMARHQDQRVKLGVVSDLVDSVHLDVRKEPSRQRAHHYVEKRQEGRVHVGRDLAEHLLGLGLSALDGDVAIGRAFVNRLLDARVADHHLLNLVTRPQRRPLDHLLFAVQEGQDRAPHHACHGMFTLGAARVDERPQVDRVTDLDRKIAVGGEKRSHLGQVRGSGGSAVEEIQEAPARTRTLAPKDGQRNHVHRFLAVPDRAHHLFQEIELGPALENDLSPRADPQPGGPQEEEERFAGPGQLAHVAERALWVSDGLDLAPGPEQSTDRVEDRSVVVETNSVGEAREPETVSQEQRIEEEVVEPARIAHHVYDRALRFERPKPLDGRIVQTEVPEEPPGERMHRQVVAARHRRDRVAELRNGRDRRGRGRLGNIERLERRILGIFRHVAQRVPRSPAREKQPPAQRPGLSRKRSPARRDEPAYSGSRISPASILAAISPAVQRPPSSCLVMPVWVTTFISAIRPWPT